MNEKSIQSFRDRELIAIYRFIDNSHPYELANILNEILVVHGLLIFDEDQKSLKPVHSIAIKGERLQINTKWEK